MHFWYLQPLEKKEFLREEFTREEYILSQIDYYKVFRRDIVTSDDAAEAIKQLLDWLNMKNGCFSVINAIFEDGICLNAKVAVVNYSWWF